MSKIKELLQNDIVQKKPSMIIFILLNVLYAVMARMTVTIAKSSNVLRFGKEIVPVAQLTGVLSSIALMCLVFMVVF